MFLRWLSLLGFLLAVPCLSGSPFQPAYVPTLGALRWDGDLSLRIPLANLRLGNSIDLEILLEHELESMEYGEVRSRFHIRPLETGLHPAENGKFVWLRPGGGYLEFSKDDLVKSDGERSVFEKSATRLVMDSSVHRGVIEDSGWNLVYTDGGLSRIEAAGGGIYDITHQGIYVTSISHDHETLLEFRVHAGSPIELRVNSRVVCHFQNNRDNLLTRVTSGAGKTIAEFTYDQWDRLARSATRSREATYEWANIAASCRGDSPFSKPAFVSMVDSIQYDYSIANGVVLLRESAPNRRRKLLRAGVRYGRLLWIKQSED